MPAINSRSERGSVQLAELSLLLAAVRGPPNPPVRLPKGRPEPSRIVIPSSRDREFESVSLRRPVRLSSEPRGRRRKAPHFGGGLRVAGDVRRDVPVTNRCSLTFFSDRY